MFLSILLPSLGLAQAKLREREAKLWVPQAKTWKENNATLKDRSLELYKEFEIRVYNVRTYESHPGYYFATVEVNKMYEFNEKNEKGEVVLDDKKQPKKIRVGINKFLKHNLMLSSEFPVFFGCGIMFTAQVFEDTAEIVVGTEHVEGTSSDETSYMKDGKLVSLDTKLTTYGLRKSTYLSDSSEWMKEHVNFLFTQLQSKVESLI